MNVDHQKDHTKNSILDADETSTVYLTKSCRKGDDTYTNSFVSNLSRHFLTHLSKIKTSVTENQGEEKS